MDKPVCVITYDIGTTGVKTCLFEIGDTIKMVASAMEVYELYVFPDGGVEQKPAEWWSAICSTTHQLLEETGTQGYSYTSLGQLYPSPGYTNEIIHLYVCRIKSEGESKPDEGEFLDVEKIPLDKAVEMVLNNQLPDAKTQVAVLKTAMLLKSGKI